MTEPELKSMIDELKIPYDKDRDISKKLFTQQKLNLLERIVYMWLTVWNKNKRTEEVVIVDSFAGRGIYFDEDQNNVFLGSPLIYLIQLFKIQNRPKSKFNGKVKLYLIEKSKKNKEMLENIIRFLREKFDLDDNILEIVVYQGDCNSCLENIFNDIDEKHKESPVFFFVDPYGMNISSELVNRMMNIPNPRDIFLNFMLFGVKRVLGGAKVEKGECLFGPISTLYTETSMKKKNALKENLIHFMGSDVVDENGELKENVDLLDMYKENFIKKSYQIRGFSVYNKCNSELYHLLYACKNDNILNVIEEFYNKELSKEEETKARIEEHQKIKIAKTKHAPEPQKLF